MLLSIRATLTYSSTLKVQGSLSPHTAMLLLFCDSFNG